MILLRYAPDATDLQNPEFIEIYEDAVDLYGLIHARYIISPAGLECMREKYI